MKKIVFAVLVMAIFAASGAHAQQLKTAGEIRREQVEASLPVELQKRIQEAKADWAERYQPILFSSLEPTSISVGFDVDRPGKFVSYAAADGALVQYGCSFSPLEFWRMMRR